MACGSERLTLTHRCDAGIRRTYRMTLLAGARFTTVVRFSQEALSIQADTRLHFRTVLKTFNAPLQVADAQVAAIRQAPSCSRNFLVKQLKS